MQGVGGQVLPHVTAAAPASGAYPYWSQPPPPQTTAYPQPYAFQPRQAIEERKSDDGDESEDEDDDTLGGALLNEGHFGAAMTMLISGGVYAVKVPKTEETFLPADFVREVFIAQAFVNYDTHGHRRTSPFVVPFRDAFFGPNHNDPEQRSAIHIAYDFAPDRDLGTWIKTGTPPPDGEQLFRALILILHGVKDLHAHGIVHGDLKLANVLVAYGWPYLADMGGAGIIGNVEPDIIDRYYADPKRSVKDQFHDVYCFHRLIHRVLEIRALGGQTTRKGVNDNGVFAWPEFSDCCRHAQFSSHHTAVLWYIYNTIREMRQVSAAYLLESVTAIYHPLGVDLNPPPEIEAAQNAFSPFTDEATLRQFVYAHQTTDIEGDDEDGEPKAYPPGAKAEATVEHWKMLALQLINDVFGNDVDMAEYLHDRSPQAVLTVLSWNILHSITDDNVQLDAAGVIAAVQLATHMVGQQRHGTHEARLLERYMALTDSQTMAGQATANAQVTNGSPTLHTIYHWEMAIVVCLWFGEVHKFIRTRWAEGFIRFPRSAALADRGLRGQYAQPPAPALAGHQHPDSSGTELAVLVPVRAF